MRSRPPRVMRNGRGIRSVGCFLQRSPPSALVSAERRPALAHLAPGRSFALVIRINAIRTNAACDAKVIFDVFFLRLGGLPEPVGFGHRYVRVECAIAGFRWCFVTAICSLHAYRLSSTARHRGQPIYSLPLWPAIMRRGACEKPFGGFKAVYSFLPKSRT